MLLWTGRIKGNNLLLNNEADSAFLMLRSKLKQSFRAEGKKEYLKQSTVEGGYTVVPCSDLLND